MLPMRKYYLDSIFDDFLDRNDQMDVMKCDIYEKGGNVHIELEVPGFNKNDIKLDVEDGILTVVAHNHEEKEEKDKNYYRKERTYGTYKRQFNVGKVSEDQINAKFNNGVLEITFPKEEKKETKKFIEIK